MDLILSRIVEKQYISGWILKTLLLLSLVLTRTSYRFIIVTERRRSFETHDKLLNVSEILYDNINDVPDCY